MQRLNNPYAEEPVRSQVDKIRLMTPHVIMGFGRAHFTKTVLMSADEIIKQKT